MDTAILTVHILVCLVLIVLVLLQAGREGMGVIFGGSNNSTFGSAGAGGLLTKLTTFLAVLFVITSLTYNIMTSTDKKGESTILDVQFEEIAIPPVTAPVVPATKPEAAPLSQAIEPEVPTIPQSVETPSEQIKQNETPAQNSAAESNNS